MNYKRSKYFIASNKQKIKYLLITKNSQITVTIILEILDWKDGFLVCNQVIRIEVPDNKKVSI